MLAIVPGLALSLFILAREIWALIRTHRCVVLDARDEYPVAAVLLIYGIGIALFGLNLATAAFLLFVLLYFARMRPLGAVLYAAILIAGINGMFMLMRLRPPGGYLATLNVI